MGKQNKQEISKQETIGNETANQEVVNSTPSNKVLTKEKIKETIHNETLFAKIKVFPKNRWFNSVFLLMMIIMFSFIGIILICLVIIFA